MSKIEELEEQIEDLQRAIKAITKMEPGGFPGDYAEVLNFHYRGHVQVGERLVRHDQKLDYISQTLKRLGREVKQIRLAIMRLGSDEAIHNLIGRGNNG